MKALEVMKKIEEEGAKVAKFRQKAPDKTYDKMSTGDVHWQGDVGLLRLESIPKDATKIDPEKQLAPGKLTVLH